MCVQPSQSEQDTRMLRPHPPPCLSGQQSEEGAGRVPGTTFTDSTHSRATVNRPAVGHRKGVELQQGRRSHNGEGAGGM